jgi:hypothetical protein
MHVRVVRAAAGQTCATAVARWKCQPKQVRALCAECVLGVWLGTKGSHNNGRPVELY